MIDLAAGLKAIHDLIEFDSAKHRYKVLGVAMESVTSVLGSTLAKGQGFYSWIAKTTREGNDWRKVGKDEADKGKAVHRSVENYARVRLGLPLLPAFDGQPEAVYLAAGLPELLDEANIEPIFQPEVRLYHPTLMYSGTMDLPMLWHGERTILDIKTCPAEDTYYQDWRLQLGGYAGALKAHGLGSWQGAVLRVPKNGSTPNILPLGDLDEDFEAFAHVLEVWLYCNKSNAKTRKAKVIDAVSTFLEAKA